MSYPEHALKTEEELRQAVKDALPLYAVTPLRWINRPGPIRIYIRDFGPDKDYNSSYRIYFSPRFLETQGYYWLKSGEACIPDCVHDTSRIYIFTNFWRAWAYNQKIRGKS